MPHAKAKQDKKQSRTSARVHAYVRTRPSPGTPSINIVSTHKFTHRQGFAFPPRVLGILVGDARVVFSEHFSAHRKPHDADSGVHDQGGRLDATIPKRRERGGGRRAEKEDRQRKHRRCWRKALVRRSLLRNKSWFAVCSRCKGSDSHGSRCLGGSRSCQHCVERWTRPRAG